MARWAIEKINYNYSLIFNQNGIDLDSGASSRSIGFSVEADSHPPTNIHALIGSNGVGKTTLLKRIANDYHDSRKNGKYQHITFGNSNSDGINFCGKFSSLVIISSSSLDSKLIEDQNSNENTNSNKISDFERVNIRQVYIGDTDEKSYIEDVKITLKKQFANQQRWCESLYNLAMPFDGHIFGIKIPNSEDTDYPFDSMFEQIECQFPNMSTGEKALFISFTETALYVQEASLVLLDEPESFLHPPLLSSWIRTLSDLVSSLNGVVIVATHSPIVVQELPKQTVNIIEKYGDSIIVRKPNIESFGETLGVLINEIF